MFDSTKAQNMTLSARNLTKECRVKWAIWRLEKDIRKACRYGLDGVEREFRFSLQTWWTGEVRDYFQNLGYHVKIVDSPYRLLSERYTLITVQWL